MLSSQALSSVCFPHTRGGGPCPASIPVTVYQFSPHAWGWTGTREGYKLFPHVFPTRVGVDLTGHVQSSRIRCFPHTRGGGPAVRVVSMLTSMFSPHAWGWTDQRTRHSRGCYVFPTRVGVDRELWFSSETRKSFPHTRGGGPVRIQNRRAELRVFPTRVGVDLPQYTSHSQYQKFSPHAWGWTALPLPSTTPILVFPTRVGVDRQASCPGRFSGCFPHTRGGGPERTMKMDGADLFSPHAWGWTRGVPAVPQVPTVFPTRVGVDLVYL